MPHGIKGWTIFLSAQAALTFIVRLLLKLAENAMLTWSDDQIAGALGFSAPQAPTVISWVVPAFFGFVILLIYHMVQSRIVSHKVHRNERKWSLTIEPIHIITLGLLISLGGVAWQIFAHSPSSATIATTSQAAIVESAVVRDARLLEGGFGASENPLTMAGTFAKGGKSIKFVIDVSIDYQTRGQNLRRIPRIKIGEVNDFVRGQAVNVILVSYFSQDRLAPPMWGPRRALSGIDDETFQSLHLQKRPYLQ